MIKPYLSDMINNHKAQEVWKVYSGNKVIDSKTPGEWKIQLTMKINFVCSRDNSNEIRTMHAESENAHILMGSETDEIIEELFESLLQNYQIDLEESVRRGNDFVIDSVDLLYYHLNKISLGRKGRSYIDSPKWLKIKKATINPKHSDNNCFQYATIAALNHKQIKNHPERISNPKPFIDQYDWKEIDFPPKQEKDWKMFESNNKLIALNILFVPYNTEEIRLAYK